MPTVIRTYDTEDKSVDYRIHFEVTSPGHAAQTYGPPERCYPAEAPEWEITGIDCECWHAEWGDAKLIHTWIPIEYVMSKFEVDSVYSWAKSLDLGDEVVEDAEAEREAWLEAEAEAKRDALEDR